jgi:predicted signal transduction protein with EAL and GGDEF domain
LRPTIGIAINPGEGTTAELLLDNAITALARAKDQETGYAFYEELAVA